MPEATVPAPDPLAEVRWAPRVPRGAIRRLYETDARGIVDEELIDRVGEALLDRCRSILTATAAHAGEVACPRCGQGIRHQWDKAAALTCPRCGWATTWGAYFKTYQHKQLHGGGAVHAFEAFTEEFPAARTPQQKMLAIDRLIHAYHWELMQSPTRPAAVNLIEGSLWEVADFLDGLAYGEAGTPETRATLAAWRAKRAKAEARWRKSAAEARD